MPEVKIKLPDHGIGEIGIRLLHQQDVTEISRIAQESELVLVAPGSFQANWLSPRSP